MALALSKVGPASFMHTFGVDALIAGKERLSELADSRLDGINSICTRCCAESLA